MTIWTINYIDTQTAFPHWLAWNFLNPKDPLKWIKQSIKSLFFMVGQWVYSFLLWSWLFSIQSLFSTLSFFHVQILTLFRISLYYCPKWTLLSCQISWIGFWPRKITQTVRFCQVLHNCKHTIKRIYQQYIVLL